MATYQITAPDGRRYRVTGQGSAEDALAAVKKSLAMEGSGQQPPAPAAPEQPQEAEPQEHWLRRAGRTVWENIVGDDDPTTQNLGEKIGSAIHTGIEAATFGLIGDEANAAVDAAIGRGPYDERRDHYRQEQRQFESDHPVLATGATLAGAVAPALVTGGAAAPLTVGRAAALGAAGGATYGFMEGEGSASDRATSAAAGGALGALGGAASIPVGRAVQWAGRRFGAQAARIFGRREYFADGQITQAGREALEAIGYNADEVSDDFVRAFQTRRAAGMTPGQAGRAAALDEFGIPANRANVTGTVDDFAAVNRAARGGSGSRMAERAGRHLGEQDAAMRQAGDDIAVRLGRGVRGDQHDAAVGAMQGLRAARDTARRAATQAYDDLAAVGGGIRGEAVSGIGPRVTSRLRMDGVLVDDGMTNASRALRMLDDTFAGGARASGVVRFTDIERTRQRLVGMRKAAWRGDNGADQYAMGRLLDSFDDEVESLFTRAMTEGGDEVLDAARKARGLWAAYARKFHGRDKGSRFIQSMIDEDATPGEAVKWLFSSGKLGSGRFNSGVAKAVKETLGEGSEQWAMIRQAAFRQLTERPEGTAQLGPQALSSRINEFLNNPATRDLARELFSPDEIRLLRRYAGALKSLVGPAGSLNTSNTAYENARAARRALDGLFGIMGLPGGGAAGVVTFALSGGNPVVGGLAGAALQGAGWLGRQAVDRAAGNALLRPTAPLGNLPAGAAVGGGVAGAAGGQAAWEAVQ